MILLNEAGISKQGEMDRLATMISLTILSDNSRNCTSETLHDLKTISTKNSSYSRCEKRKMVIIPEESLLSSTLQADFFGLAASHASLSHLTVLKQGQRGIVYHLCFPNGDHFTWSYAQGFPYLTDCLNRAIKTACCLGLIKR